MKINNAINFGKKILHFNRSLTGSGSKKTLIEIRKFIPKLQIKYFKSGSKVFDWEIPSEWSVSRAYVIDSNNKKIIDFSKNNLHLLGYSTKVNQSMNFQELKKNLYYDKDNPDAIPYRTSYYKRNWGFCLSFNQFKKLKQFYSKKKNLNKKFKVLIDAKFKSNGKMHYGELFIKGKTKQEIILSTYICHPSQANDGVSGILANMLLYENFKKQENSKCMRFLFLPETIGSIAYINKNLKKLKKNFYGGYVLTCLGDDRNYSYIKSKNIDSFSNRAALKLIKDEKIKCKIYSFLERGSCERQYNSPGVDLSFGSILKTKYLNFKEYHSSKDDFKLVTPRGLRNGYNFVRKIITVLDLNCIPKYKYICEPFLQKYNLYRPIGSNKQDFFSRSICNFLQYCDGKNDLITISEILNLKFSDITKIFNFLCKKKLVYKEK